jgi:hypothetical protein
MFLKPSIVFGSQYEECLFEWCRPTVVRRRFRSARVSSGDGHAGSD